MCGFSAPHLREADGFVELVVPEVVSFLDLSLGLTVVAPDRLFVKNRVFDWRQLSEIAEKNHRPAAERLFTVLSCGDFSQVKVDRGKTALAHESKFVDQNELDSFESPPDLSPLLD